jgi:hypothetical protein
MLDLGFDRLIITCAMIGLIVAYWITTVAMIMTIRYYTKTKSVRAKLKVENLKKLHQIFSDTLYYIMFIPITFHSAKGFVSLITAPSDSPADMALSTVIFFFYSV